MSRWLKNVGAFLEQLDDQAERVAEEADYTNDDELSRDDDDHRRNDVQAILQQQRPRVSLDENPYNENDNEFKEEEGDEEKNNVATGNSSIQDSDTETIQNVLPTAQEGSSTGKIGISHDVTNLSRLSEQHTGIVLQESTIKSVVADIPTRNDNNDRATDGDEFISTPLFESMDVSLQQHIVVDEQSHEKVRLLESKLEELREQVKDQQMGTREANKEARTLRRHMISLNQQLEGADKEIEAQRKELEQAAVLLEQNRVKFKEERNKELARHQQEIKVLTAQHNVALQNVQSQCDGRIAVMRLKLEHMEKQRRQEGGDLVKELADAATRQQELEYHIAALEDEKATFLSQISTLQTQQEALGSQLESLTHTAEQAMARERDADQRLDDVLSQHAHQIAQRQARESELESSVAQLGAALVTARQQQQQQQQQQTYKQAAGEHTKDVSSENETLRVQLEQECQQVQLLQAELRSLAQERTEQAVLAQTRQSQYDRRIQELSRQVGQLQADLQNQQQRENHGSIPPEQLQHVSMEDAVAQQERLQALSDEVVRQRATVSSCHAEISALRARLHMALNRATVAEAAAESSFDVVDRGNNNSTQSSRSRRRGNHHSSSTGADRLPSLRTALHLDTASAIGSSFDAIDDFVTKSSKVLRFNPVARLFFVLYLLLLHFWTFALLFFHAHAFENVHGDFGGALPHPQRMAVPVGPVSGG